MNSVLHVLALGLVKFLQALPLRWVARLGRAAGALAYLLDVRHRKVALRNLTAAFGAEKTGDDLRALAREHFRRLGENYCCAVRTAAMTWAELEQHCQFVGEGKFFEDGARGDPRSCVVAIGHFGNFELYARIGNCIPAFRCGTTYRGIRPEALDRILLSLRERSGCRFFERRTQGNELKAFMQERGVILGLLSDQHAGRGGVWLPFFGRDCSTTPAPAVFAQRYDCRLHTGICYRVGLARWRIEVGDEIPTAENGRRRSTDAILRDVNRVFEAAVRRDPANWFWVHNRWKTKP